MTKATFVACSFHDTTVRQQYPKGLGWRYEAHLRGLELCSIYLTTTKT